MRADEFIDKIVNDIFQYRINSVADDIVSVFEAIFASADIIDSDDILKLNEIMKCVHLAIGNKDYLLIADMMKYELKPLLAKQADNGENIDVDIPEKS